MLEAIAPGDPRQDPPSPPPSPPLPERDSARRDNNRHVRFVTPAAASSSRTPRGRGRHTDMVQRKADRRSGARVELDIEDLPFFLNPGYEASSES